jgi:phenylacetate-coenzyme A ligase PaaK-like adenylate-forming protein
MLPRILWYLSEIRREFGLSAEELAKVRTRKLRRLVPYAYREIPYYRSRPERSRFSSGLDIGLEEYQQIPTISGDQVKRYNHAFRAPNPGSVYIKRTTGTTTGKPDEIYWGAAFADRIMAMNIRRVTIIGAHPWDSMARIYPIPATVGEKKTFAPIETAKRWLAQPFSQHGFTLRPITIWIRYDDLLGTVKALVRAKPTRIQLRASLARTMIRILREHDLRVEPKLLEMSGEVLTRRDRRFIESEFGAPIRQGYGLAELGGVGTECRFGCFHLYTDEYHQEVLRDGQPVSPGEWGELVVTALDNFAMPLLRYRTGDHVRLDSDQRKCECGSTMMNIKSIMGRARDSLTTPAGDVIPQAVVLDALESSSGLCEYQLVQRERLHFLLRVSAKDRREGRERFAVECLKRLLGDAAELETEVWERKEESPRYRPIVVERPKAAQPSIEQFG